MYDTIGNGWKDAFQNKINKFISAFPDSKIISLQRDNGLLKVKFDIQNDDLQFIADSVSYKIERESARICENCGLRARRVDEFLLEKKCLCWKCYATEIDTNAKISHKEV
jgi:hypothetical protein